MPANLSQLGDKIFASNQILIISHRLPDADTLGSAAALCYYLQAQLGKTANFFCVDAIPKNLEFLQLTKFCLTGAPPSLSFFDLIICVDSGDLSQTGLTEEILNNRNNLFLINIDHHQTNNHFGNINIVEAAGATAEIIYKILKSLNATCTREISTALLAGIISDTTYFTTAGTTKDSMAIASELLKHNANSKLVIQNTWRKNSPAALKVWGKILSQLHYNAEHKIVTAIITKDDALLPEIFEGLANFLTTLYEADMIIVLRETTDAVIKCSLRTTREHLDVAKLALAFGGGGHAKAAGFSLNGQLQQTANGWQIN